MGRFEWMDMAFLGNTQEERKIGNIMTTLINMNSTTGTPSVSFEAMVSPLPKDELFFWSRRRDEIEKPYAAARKEYEAKHKKLGDFDYMKMLDELKDPYKEIIERLRAIDHQIMGGKQQVFTDLAYRFRAMMVGLRGLSVMQMSAINYAIAKEALKEVPEAVRQKIGTDLEEHATTLDSYAREAFTEGISEELTKKIGNNDKRFFSEISTTLRDAGVKPKFNHSMMAGKLSGSYFNDLKEFLTAFDWAAGFQHNSGYGIHFYLHGMIEGEYSLERDSMKEFKDFEYVKDSGDDRYLSPVRLSITVPEFYAGFVGPVFDGIRKDYAGRIVMPEEIRQKKPGISAADAAASTAAVLAAVLPYVRI